jgi:hypothetical protein
VKHGPESRGIWCKILSLYHEFYGRISRGKVSAHQLTATKLERLKDRYIRKEWQPSRRKHLDSPRNERADVIRGLRTYCSASPENRKNFAELYSRLPEARRALEPEIIKELTIPSLPD